MSKIFPILKPHDKYTSLGSYPIVYYAKIWSWHGGEQLIPLCACCADTYEQRKEWESNNHNCEKIDEITPEVYYEGPPIICEECNEEIPSAYGDPNADDQACPD